MAAYHSNTRARPSKDTVESLLFKDQNRFVSGPKRTEMYFDQSRVRATETTEFESIVDLSRFTINDSRSSLLELSGEDVSGYEELR